MQTVENTFLDIWVSLFKFADKLFDFLPFCAARFLNKLRVGKAAGALNETQTVVSCPRDDIVFVNAVERSDKLHELIGGYIEIVRLGNGDESRKT